MKKIASILFFVAVVIMPLTSHAQASCVNGVYPATGQPCLTVNGSQTSGASTGACPDGSTPANLPNGQPGGCNLGYTPLEPIPGLTTDNNNGQLDFPHLLGNLYKILITVGALFSVLMLTISGIRYMLSDVVTDKAKAIQRIKACIYGLVLIAASYLILYTINPKLLEFSLQPCPQTSAGCTISPTTPINTSTSPVPGSQLPAQQVVPATNAESAVNSQVLTQAGTDTALTLTVPVNCASADNVINCLSEVRDKTNAFNSQCSGLGGTPQPVSGSALGSTADKSVYICKI